MKIIIQVIVFLLFLSGVSKADESRDLFDLSLEELLNTKVTIASRNETPLWKNPSSVTLFTHIDIERLGLRTLTDLLSMVPGFYSMMDSVEGNLSHVVMRGHAQNYANTLLVLLNGQRINDDYTGGLNYFIRYFSIRHVSRIEVIRGPGSALYGSNAYSGVINIITNSDMDDEVNAEYGSFDLGSLNGHGQIAFDNWDLGGSFYLYRDRGETFQDVFDRNGLQNTTQDPRNVEQLSLFSKSERSRIDFHYLHSRRNDYYLFRRLRDGVTQLDLNHWMLHGSYTLFQSSDWRVDLSGGYQNATRNSLSALVAGGTAPYTQADFLFGLDFKYRSANLGLDATYQVSDDFTINTGISYSTSDIPRSYLKSNYDIFGDENYLGQLVTFDSDPSMRSVLDKTRKIKSAYVQGQWNLTPRFTLTTGLRYDAYNDIDNALNPRISLVHELDNSQGYKLIYGEAYRAPSLGDLYDEESGLTVGNRTLKANQTSSFEAVYFRHQTNSNITLTFFDNRQRNLVAPYNDGTLSYLANIGSSETHGLELEWQWRPAESWQLKTAITHLLKNQSQLLPEAGLTPSEFIAPNNYLNYDIQYNHQNWSFNFSGNWRDRVDVLTDKDSLLLVNMHLNYQISDHLCWNLNARNLTDEQFFTSTYSPIGADANGNTIQELPARGRQLTLELSYKM